MEHVFFVASLVLLFSWNTKATTTETVNNSPIVGTIDSVYHTSGSNLHIKYTDVTFENTSTTKSAMLDIRQGQIFNIEGDNDYQIIVPSCIDTTQEQIKGRFSEGIDESGHRYWTLWISPEEKISFTIKCYCQDPGWGFVPPRGTRFTFYTGYLTFDESRILDNCNIPQAQYHNIKTTANQKVQSREPDWSKDSNITINTSLSGTSLKDYAEALETGLRQYISNKYNFGDRMSVSNFYSKHFNRIDPLTEFREEGYLNGKYAQDASNHWYPRNGAINICLTGEECVDFPTIKVGNIHVNSSDGYTISFRCDISCDPFYLSKKIVEGQTMR